jgi:hypothetical protein
MKEGIVFSKKYQSPPPFLGLGRFHGGFFAAFMLAAALLVSGCDILNKLGITPGDDDGEGKPAAAVPVAFDGITVDKSATTTSLTLVFDRDIPGLEAGDITLTPETPELAGITVAGLTGDGTGTYILALSGVDKPDGDEPGQTGALGAIAVGVSKGGYAVSPASRPTLVYYVDPVLDADFVSVTADGTAGTATTTRLALTFSREIAGLTEKDITINASGTGAVTEGAFSHNGAVYYLEIGGIHAAGEITVVVSKSGYRIDPASQTVQIYGKGLPVAGQESNPSIKAKFGVTSGGTTGVTAAFNALHDFIQGGGLAAQSDVIKTGDWIDLEGGLAVEAYGGIDNNGGGGFSHDEAKAVEAVTYKGNVAWGTLCRIIVVGVNSFNGKNGNDTPHVVFQFQNLPVMRRMNPTNTNAGGYEKSEMRTYLTGNFLTGLNNAGVPDGVLWGPVRYLSAGTNGTGTTKITDKLWLPTEREMFGSGSKSADGEKAGNQARLEYYTDYNTRLKSWYGNAAYYPDMKNGSGLWYWTGSAYSGGSASFCIVYFGGSPHFDGASYADGVAPAFCVN